METNTRTHTRNKQNAITRWFIIMNAWTMLYNAIAQCCEKTAPILFRTIFDSCNLEKTRGIVGGFFDGPRAWAIVLVWLSGGRRTKSDKDYYRLAEKLQREHDLPDGCLESEYSKKALAWIIQIAPNHPLKYEAIDSGEWLIDMMPQSLGADKRRLKDMLTKDGRITNLREVMRLCSAIVFDAQSPAATPTCFSLPALDVQPFNVLDLSETCGMALSIDIERPGAFAAATASAGDCEWCASGPHVNRFGKPVVCRRSPYYNQSLPPWLDQNEAKRMEIEAARKAHVEKEIKAGRQIEYKPLPRASNADVTKWRASEEARKKPGSDAEGTKSGGAAGVAADADFFANIKDLDDPDFGKNTGGVALELLTDDGFGEDIAAMMIDSPSNEVERERGSSFYKPLNLEQVNIADLPGPTALPSIPDDAQPELQAVLASCGGGGGGGVTSFLEGGPQLEARASSTRASSAPPPTPLPAAVTTVGDGMTFHDIADISAADLTTPPPPTRPPAATDGGAPTRTTATSGTAPTPPATPSGLATATNELAEAALVQLTSLTTPREYNKDYAVAMLFAVLVGVASACVTFQQAAIARYDTAGMIGGVVVLAIIKMHQTGLTRLITGARAIFATTSNVSIVILTALVRAATFVVVHAQALTIIFIILCGLSRGAFGLSPANGGGHATNLIGLSPANDSGHATKLIGLSPASEGGYATNLIGLSPANGGGHATNLTRLSPADGGGYATKQSGPHTAINVTALGSRTATIAFSPAINAADLLADDWPVKSWLRIWLRIACTQAWFILRLALLLPTLATFVFAVLDLLARREQRKGFDRYKDNARIRIAVPLRNPKRKKLQVRKKQRADMAYWHAVADTAMDILKGWGLNAPARQVDALVGRGRARVTQLEPILKFAAKRVTRYEHDRSFISFIVG